MNNVTITIEDEHPSSFAVALVHTQPKTAALIADETPACEEEDALRRVRMLLKDTWGISMEEFDLGSKPEPPPEPETPPMPDAPKLDEEDEEVTCVLSNKLRLRCPLSFERVDIPVRGETCMHLQCFGLGAYLEANMKMRALNNRWTCPVCSNILKPHDLVVDKYVQKVLSETPAHVEEVIIEKDGTYRIVEDEDAAAGKDASKNETDNAEQVGANDTPMTDADQQDGIKRQGTDDGIEVPLSKRQRRRQKILEARGELPHDTVPAAEEVAA